MPSYRFCRSDDVPLLVQAHEACWRPHFPDAASLTVEGFKRRIREIDLWTSSCMVAGDDAGPVAVLLAAKRERETLIWRIACRPDSLRQGHGGHLLASLGAKLAILGPPRLVAEVPAVLGGARRFFEACGWRAAGGWAEWIRPVGRPTRDDAPGAVPFVMPVTAAELDAAGALDPGDEPVRWGRAPATLLALGDRLRGLAVASPERVEAWVLFEPGAGGDETRVVATGAAEEARRDMWLDLLLDRLAATSAGPLRVVGPAPGSPAARSWGDRGFLEGPATVRYTIEARPA